TQCRRHYRCRFRTAVRAGVCASAAPDTSARCRRPSGHWQRESARSVCLSVVWLYGDVLEAHQRDIQFMQQRAEFVAGQPGEFACAGDRVPLCGVVRMVMLEFARVAHDQFTVAGVTQPLPHVLPEIGLIVQRVYSGKTWIEVEAVAFGLARETPAQYMHDQDVAATAAGAQ